MPDTFRQEIAGPAAAGCRYLQIDEVATALPCDPAIRERVAAVGADPDARPLYRRLNQAIGPQCGFASTAAGNPLSEADERAELRLVVEAARAIRGWSIFRKSGHRFSVENAIKQTNLERIPVQLNRDAL